MSEKEEPDTLESLRADLAAFGMLEVELQVRLMVQSFVLQGLLSGLSNSALRQMKADVARRARLALDDAMGSEKSQSVATAVQEELSRIFQ